MEDAVLEHRAPGWHAVPFYGPARLAVAAWAGATRRRSAWDGELETAYCAEVVALTYQAMGLLPGGRRPNW
jgi:hypothetical protein